MNRHLFVINPVAGKKDRTVEIKEAIEALDLKEPFTVAATCGEGYAIQSVREYIKAHPNDFIRIYACGGDGTLCEAAQGIYESGSDNCALGCIPIGSGNDFIKSFDDLTSADFRSIKKMTEGEYKPIDLINVTDENGKQRICVNIVSVGFDAAVARMMKKFKRLPLITGSGAYKLAVLCCLVTKTKNRFSVIIDDKAEKEKEHDYFFVIGANGRYYGGGYKASPYSELSDGFMNFIRIRSVSRIKFVKLVGIFRRGDHIEQLADITEHCLCKKMQILSDKPFDLNLDGESVLMTNPTYELIERKMNLILPQPERK